MSVGSELTGLSFPERSDHWFAMYPELVLQYLHEISTRAPLSLFQVMDSTHKKSFRNKDPFGRIIRQVMNGAMEICDCELADGEATHCCRLRSVDVRHYQAACHSETLACVIIICRLSHSLRSFTYLARRQRYRSDADFDPSAYEV
jgi:hypothetical protein